MKRIIQNSPKIGGEVFIPGSKSYTNRAFIIAALTPGETEIRNPLLSDDTDAMMNCLTTLGYDVRRKDQVVIIGARKELKSADPVILNAQISGTTIRFILALASALPGKKIVTGEAPLRKRPIAELVEGLKQLGADLSYQETQGNPPILVGDSPIHKGTTVLNGNISSQYFSAILMAAPAVGGVTIRVNGHQISQSFIDMTIDIMKHFGVQVINDNYESYTIKEGERYKADSYTVEGDYSAAGYFFALAALSNSTISLKNLNPESVQGDRQFSNILEKMGATINSTPDGITITGNGVKPVEVSMEQCPDQAQTLAVLAAFAKGKTVLTGIRSLRVKETERVVAVQTELAKMGIKTDATYDTLTIYGGEPKKAEINTYGDHRMAMSFAVAGAKLPGLIINDPQVVSKTFPHFWDAMSGVGLISTYG